MAHAVVEGAVNFPLDFGRLPIRRRMEPLAALDRPALGSRHHDADFRPGARHLPRRQRRDRPRQRKLAAAIASAKAVAAVVNTLAGIWGDYAVTAPMETFVVSKGDDHPTDLAMLREPDLSSRTKQKPAATGPSPKSRR
jgi:hypothetical protein